MEMLNQQEVGYCGLSCLVGPTRQHVYSYQPVNPPASIQPAATSVWPSVGVIQRFLNCDELM